MSTANMFVTVLTVSCFSLALSANVVVKKIEVQMGAVGSDDDIRIKMCEGSKCCTTDKLSNILGSEWDAKKKEKWDGGKLGNCSDVSFSDNLPFLDATIIKKGKKDKEGPEVVNMNITGRIGKDKKNVVIFNCGIYKLSKTDRQKSGKCINPKYVAPVPKSLPPPSLSSVPIVANYNINKISVQMGDDGTDDDVSLEVNFKTNRINQIFDILVSRFVTNKVQRTAVILESWTKHSRMTGRRRSWRCGRKNILDHAKVRYLMPVKDLMLVSRRRPARIL